MKNLYLILITPLLFGCNDNEIARTQAKDPLTKVIALKGGGFITYKIVEIDGVTYFASRTANGNYVIGPKTE
jgi:hypothetical protein